MHLKFPRNSPTPRKMLPQRGKFPGFVLFLGALFFVNLLDEFGTSGLHSAVHIAPHIIRADTTFERSTRVIVACWVPCMNSTADLLRIKAIRHSWGRHCNTIDFIDKETPGIIADWTDVYEDLAAKSYRAWKFMYHKYLSSDNLKKSMVDFVLKADTDTYIIGENMREYLKQLEPDRRYYIGKNFVDLNGDHFVAGAAIIMSRTALGDFAHANSHNCTFEKFRERRAEDLALGLCLRDLNIIPHDARDHSGAERFMVFNPDMMRLGQADGQLPSWYYKFSKNKIVGKGCCSTNAVAFHYVTIQQLQSQVLVLHDGEWYWSNQTDWRQ